MENRNNKYINQVEALHRFTIATGTGASTVAVAVAVRTTQRPHCIKLISIIS